MGFTPTYVQAQRAKEAAAAAKAKQDAAYAKAIAAEMARRQAAGLNPFTGQPLVAQAQPMPWDTASLIQQSGLDTAYEQKVQQLTGQRQLMLSHYGAGAGGQVDWEHPVDPFSVSGNLKEMFRKQRDSSFYSQAHGGFMHDGSSVYERALSTQDELRQRRAQQDTLSESLDRNSSDQRSALSDLASQKANLAASLASSWASNPSSIRYV